MYKYIFTIYTYLVYIERESGRKREKERERERNNFRRVRGDPEGLRGGERGRSDIEAVITYELLFFQQQYRTKSLGLEFCHRVDARQQELKKLNQFTLIWHSMQINRTLQLFLNVVFLLFLLYTCKWSFLVALVYI